MGPAYPPSHHLICRHTRTQARARRKWYAVCDRAAHTLTGRLGPQVLFNDRKVAVSETTPLDVGYIYVFKRRDE